MIGCGDWGSNHVRTLKSLGALAAVADNDPERMRATAEAKQRFRRCSRGGCREISTTHLWRGLVELPVER